MQGMAISLTSSDLGGVAVLLLDKSACDLALSSYTVQYHVAIPIEKRKDPQRTSADRTRTRSLLHVNRSL